MRLFLPAFLFLLSLSSTAFSTSNQAFSEKSGQPVEDSLKTLFKKHGFELAVKTDSLNQKKFYIGDIKTKRYTLLQPKQLTGSIIHKPYRRQLLWYLNSYPGVFESIRTSEYTQASLTSIFNKIDQIVLDEQARLAIKNEKSKAKLSFFSGVSSSTIQMKSETQRHIGESLTFPSSQAPVFGISLDVVLARTMKRASINNEIHYTSFSTVAQVRENGLGKDLFTLHTNRIAFSSLRLDNHFRYRIYLGSHFSIYAQAGLSTGIKVQETNMRDIVIHDITGSTQREDLVLSTTSVEFGATAGGGLRLSRFFAEFRQSLASGFASNNSGVQTSTTRSYLIIGFTISRTKR